MYIGITADPPKDSIARFELYHHVNALCVCFCRNKNNAPDVYFSLFLSVMDTEGGLSLVSGEMESAASPGGHCCVD